MVKFDDASSPGFRTVVEAIIRYCRDASASIQLRRKHAVNYLSEERRVELLQTLRRAGLPATAAIARMPGPILGSLRVAGTYRERRAWRRRRMKKRKTSEDV